MSVDMQAWWNGLGAAVGIVGLATGVVAGSNAVLKNRLSKVTIGRMQAAFLLAYTLIVIGLLSGGLVIGR